MSIKTKHIVIGLGVLAVGYVLLRNADITRRTNLAKNQGFNCGKCENGIKLCENEGKQQTRINCKYLG